MRERGVSQAVRRRAARPSSKAAWRWAVDERSHGELQSVADFVSGAEPDAAVGGEPSPDHPYADSTPAKGRIAFAPSLARGLSYYTGAIMEVTVPDLAGSLGGGGRYDNLVGMFLGQSVPACGFSLGLERILVVMGERNMFPPALATSPADVMVAVFDAKDCAHALARRADAAGRRPAGPGLSGRRQDRQADQVR